MMRRQTTASHQVLIQRLKGCDKRIERLEQRLEELRMSQFRLMKQLVMEGSLSAPKCWDCIEGTCTKCEEP